MVVDGQVRVSAVAEAELAAWVAECRGEAVAEVTRAVPGGGEKERVREPWRQVWQDRESGELVDFAEMVDAGELVRASVRAEGQYLEELRGVQETALAGLGEVARAEGLHGFRRAVCWQELYFLLKYVLGYDRMVFHLHYFMARQVENLPAGFRGLFEGPRDTFKTTVWGIGRCVQEVLRNGNVRLCYKSQSEDNAAKKVTEAKNFFKNCTLLRGLFPEHAIRTKGQEGSDSEWNTPAKTAAWEEATLTARGVLSSSASQHYDIILGDDFWDEKAVTTPDVMAKTRRQLNLLEPLLAEPPAGVIYFLGTRFAFDDITNDLQGNPQYVCTVVSGITPWGRSLFPEQLTLEYLYGLAHGQEGGAYTFWCQYMLVPKADAAGFQREWFSYLGDGELRRMEAAGELATRTLILSDASATKKKGSDEAALGVVKVDSLKRVTLVECVCRRMAPTEFVDEAFRLADRWTAGQMVVQKASIDTVIVSFVQERNRERAREGRRTLGLIEYSLRGEEKKSRITRALQPLVQTGALKFDPGLAELGELEAEFLAHPHSQQDHRLDMLAELGDPRVRRAPPAPAAAVVPAEYRPAASAVKMHESGIAQRRRMTREAIQVAEAEKDGPAGLPGEVAA